MKLLERSKQRRWNLVKLYVEREKRFDVCMGWEREREREKEIGSCLS